MVMEKCTIKIKSRKKENEKLLKKHHTAGKRQSQFSNKGSFTPKVVLLTPPPNPTVLDTVCTLHEW